MTKYDGKATPRLPDMNLIAGLKNYGVPICDPKAKSAVQESLMDKFLINMRIQDEQDFIGRYKWFGLPEGIDQELLERMFYYRGQVGFFYDKTEKRAYILPYVLNGTIDIYGRYTGVSFLPFNGKAETDKKKVYIPGEGRKPVYDVLLPDELTIDAWNDSCVLCTDYTKQMAQEVMPRAITQDCVLRTMAEVYPFARTALISNSGLKVMRLSNSNQVGTVAMMNQTQYQALLNGDTFLGFVGDPNTEQMPDTTPAKSEEYFLYLQSLENLRLSFLGLENGGIFQKKAHELQSENDMISGNTSRIYNDGLKNRQRWCTIINSIWGLGMWCMPAETESMMDQNGDGLITNGEEEPSTTPTNDEGGDENADAV